MAWTTPEYIGPEPSTFDRWVSIACSKDAFSTECPKCGLRLSTTRDPRNYTQDKDTLRIYRAIARHMAERHDVYGV